ncbi:hypothetical protein [Sandaracinobacteroides saxicola]|uniref:Uncharacterized protein n=1 Tax=Sandaracinobacteroides saxicola TaxID=2759707 RepID=A0A7G5IKJ2_9SPHN|nr:hypothetical protein [Sandaracinobacteroides saxicola]QMW23884.1 hypothetical protein H3309_05270 [Sandaracinobacteroides saxicola]
MTAPEPITMLADAIAARFPGTQAVIFYGAAHRRDPSSGLPDFYAVVAGYPQAHRTRLAALANALLPPNVYHLTAGGRRAKVAVVSTRHFQRDCGPHARDISLLARMAQPVRVVRCTPAFEPWLRAGLAHAQRTLLAHTLPLLPPDTPPSAVWENALARSYGCELRAESSGRASAIIAADPMHFAATPAVPLPSAATARRWWRRMRRRGKLFSVLRLLKASFTYTGGLDYLADKISRHSGATVIIRPWMRRVPMLAGLILAPRLWLQGAIR